MIQSHVARAAYRCRRFILDLLVAVGVFLSGHMTIVLHVAFVKILADVIVVLNVIGS